MKTGMVNPGMAVATERSIKYPERFRRRIITNCDLQANHKRLRDLISLSFFFIREGDECTNLKNGLLSLPRDVQ